MTRKEFEKEYWKYYLILEADFLVTERYLTIHPKNAQAFSVEYIKQIDSVCSEVDVLLKQYCKQINATSTAGNICGYATELLAAKTDFTTRIIKQKNGNAETFQPWLNWTPGASPQWWKNYNAIKHHRTELNNTGEPNYTLANQATIMNALAALFQTAMYMYKDLAKAESADVEVPVPASQLFTIENWDDTIVVNKNLILKPTEITEKIWE